MQNAVRRRSIHSACKPVRRSWRKRHRFHVLNAQMLVLYVALDELSFRRVATSLVVVVFPPTFIYNVITVVSCLEHKGLPTCIDGRRPGGYACIVRVTGAGRFRVCDRGQLDGLVRAWIHTRVCIAVLIVNVGYLLAPRPSFRSAHC